MCPRSTRRARSRLTWSNWSQCCAPASTSPSNGRAYSEGVLLEAPEDLAIDREVTRRGDLEVGTQVAMQRRQRVERHRRKGVMLGVIRHVPGQETDCRIAACRARVRQHVRHERAERVLRQQIKPQERLAGEHG